MGDQPPNPVLDIEAEADLTGLNATINVTGTGSRPEIAFNSIPALPQDELLSRVLFGASISDLSAPEAVQLAAAVASLNSGGGLDPINQLRKAVGLDRLRILPADVTTGQSTSIAAGKYITRRAYVELITDGQGYSATRLEFQITRWLSDIVQHFNIGTTEREYSDIQGLLRKLIIACKSSENWARCRTPAEYPAEENQHWVWSDDGCLAPGSYEAR